MAVRFPCFPVVGAVRAALLALELVGAWPPLPGCYCRPPPWELLAMARHPRAIKRSVKHEEREYSVVRKSE